MTQTQFQRNSSWGNSNSNPGKHLRNKDNGLDKLNKSNKLNNVEKVERRDRHSEKNVRSKELNSEEKNLRKELRSKDERLEFKNDNLDKNNKFDRVDRVDRVDRIEKVEKVEKTHNISNDTSYNNAKESALIDHLKNGSKHDRKISLNTYEISSKSNDNESNESLTKEASLSFHTITSQNSVPTNLSDKIHSSDIDLQSPQLSDVPIIHFSSHSTQTHADLESILVVDFISVSSHESIPKQFSKINILFPKINSTDSEVHQKVIEFEPNTNKQHKNKIMDWKVMYNQNTLTHLNVKNLEKLQFEYKILIQFFATANTNTNANFNSNAKIQQNDFVLKTYEISLNQLFSSNFIEFYFGNNIYLKIHHTIKEKKYVHLQLKSIQLEFPIQPYRECKTYLEYTIGKSDQNPNHLKSISDHVNETEIVQGFPIIQWVNVRSFTLFSSIDELFSLSLYAKAFIINNHGKSYLSQGFIEIPFKNIDFLTNYLIFKNLLSESSLNGQLSGVLSFQYLPKFVQYINSVLTVNCMNDEISTSNEGKPMIQNSFIFPKRMLEKELFVSKSKSQFKSDSSPTLNFLEKDNLIIDEDELTVEYSPKDSQIVKPGIVYAAKNLSEIRGNYFEVKVLRTGFDYKFLIGLSNESTYQSLGEDSDSFAISESGEFISNGKTLSIISREIDAGDIIGCGVYNGALFFTLNGDFLGFTKYPIYNSNLTPCAHISCKYTQLRFNFGQKKFIFNFMKIIPKDWKMEIDEQGKIYYKHSSRNIQSYSYPIIQTPEWEKYSAMNEHLVLQLGSERKGSWKGITNYKLLNAFKIIPRSAFIEYSLVPRAGSGLSLISSDNTQYLSAFVIALALQSLQLKSGDKFLSIGSNCAWSTALGSYLVGPNSQSIGILDSDTKVELAKKSILSLSNYRNISFTSAQFYNRTLFGFSNFDVPINIIKHFDSIFCESQLSQEDLKELSSFGKENTLLVCFQNSELTLFKLKSGNWIKEQVLLKYDSKFISRIQSPTQQEIYAEKRLRITEYLKNHSRTEKEIAIAIHNIH